MSERRERSSALRNFTRNLNLLNELFDEAAENILVTPQFEKVKSCWEKLEDAHDRFMATVDEKVMDIDTDPEGYQYIDESTGKYNKTLKRYSAYLKWSQSTQRDETERKKKEDEDTERESSIESWLKIVKRRRYSCVRQIGRKNLNLQLLSSCLLLSLSVGSMMILRSLS